MVSRALNDGMREGQILISEGAWGGGGDFRPMYRGLCGDPTLLWLWSSSPEGVSQDEPVEVEADLLAACITF
jgi:hypothetical protein